MRQLSLAIVVAATGFTLLPSVARAQEPGEQLGMAARRGEFAGMQRVEGEVTAVNGPVLTLKSADGSLVKVATTDNTRVMLGRAQSIRVAEVTPGEGVLAVGNLDAPNKTLHAAMMMVTTADQVKQLKENLGKTYIAGKVTAIDSDAARLTVLRADGVSQVIGLDESTSFRRGGGGMRGGRLGGAPGQPGGTPPGAAGGASSTPPRFPGGRGEGASGGESITLADIKVGDNVVGQGSLKSGVFVPGVLNVMAPRPRREGAATSGGSGAAGAQPPQ